VGAGWAAWEAFAFVGALRRVVKNKRKKLWHLFANKTSQLNGKFSVKYEFWIVQTNVLL
jgi:hypothetical protein